MGASRLCHTHIDTTARAHSCFSSLSLHPTHTHTHTHTHAHQLTRVQSLVLVCLVAVSLPDVLEAQLAASALVRQELLLCTTQVIPQYSDTTSKVSAQVIRTRMRARLSSCDEKHISDERRLST